MCVSSDRLRVETIRKRANSRGMLVVYKELDKDGRTLLYSARGQYARRGMRYQPGWNQALMSNGSPVLADHKYRWMYPRGCHVYWKPTKSRGWGTIEVECRVLVREVLAADREQLAAARVFISKAAWKRAGLPMPERMKDEG